MPPRTFRLPERPRRTHPTPTSESITQFVASYFSDAKSSPQSLPPLNPNPIHHYDYYESQNTKNQHPTTSDRSFWTRKIHMLCTRDRNVDQALRLLDSICVNGYCPDSLNLKSIVHAFCDAGRYTEAHRWLHSNISMGCVPDEQSCDVLIARLLASRDPHGVLALIRSLRAVNPAFIPSIINFNRLIDQFCSVSHPDSARAAFDEMVSSGLSPNAVSYTTLINGYCEAGDVGTAQKVFDEMCGKGIPPNVLTCSILIRGVYLNRDFIRGQQLMNELWDKMRSGLDSSSVINAAFANLMDTLCKVGLFHEVFHIAEDMPQGISVPEEFAYAQMVDSLCRVGKHHGASRILYIMKNRGLTPSLVSYNAIIHGLSKEGGCMRAFQLFEGGIRHGYVPSEYTYKALVDSLCREGDLAKAKDVLQYMLHNKAKDKTRIYNIYLRAICLMDNPTELVHSLDSMFLEHCQPDEFSLNTVLHGLCKMHRVDGALKVLNDMISGKFCSPDSVSFTTVICGLLKTSKTEEALDLLHKVMPARGIQPGVVTYNAVLSGLFKLAKGQAAMETYKSMIKEAVVADSTTYAIIIDGLFETNQVNEAKRFWHDVIWPSKVHDNFVYASIVKGFCRSRMLHEACDFVYEMADVGISPNVVSYNILIDSACESGMKNLAYQIVGEMKKNGVSPDAVTWRILNKLNGNMRMEFVQEDAMA